jgi:hypothetical protein
MSGKAPEQRVGSIAWRGYEGYCADKSHDVRLRRVRFPGRDSTLVPLRTYVADRRDSQGPAIGSARGPLSQLRAENPGLVLHPLSAARLTERNQECENWYVIQGFRLGASGCLFAPKIELEYSVNGRVATQIFDDYFGAEVGETDSCKKRLADLTG